jgi:hypothetical protein
MTYKEIFFGAYFFADDVVLIDENNIGVDQK